MSLVASGARGVADSFRAVRPRWADLVAMRHRPLHNLMAGVTVAVVALPLALGFGVASGLGAAAGLATAIVAGQSPRSPEFFWAPPSGWCMWQA